MRLELTRVGLLVELANHYTTRGALAAVGEIAQLLFSFKNGFRINECILDAIKIKNPISYLFIIVDLIEKSTANPNFGFVFSFMIYHICVKAIIIIVSFCVHEFPRRSLSLSLSHTHTITHTHTFRLYYVTVPAGHRDYILCLYRAVVDKSELVVQQLHVRVKWSRGERRLWVCPYFCSSVQMSFCLIWSVLEIGGRWP